MSEPTFDQESADGTPPRPSRRWYLWLGLIALGGMVIPTIWVVRFRHPFGINDAYYFYLQAKFLFDGDGWFISPFVYLQHPHVVLPGASHPPLWTLLLVVADALGLRSYEAGLLWSCLVGGAAVFMTGLAAREAAGPRAGLIAGVLAAAYPNYWINYGLGLGETPLLLLIAAVILVSIKVWRRPTVLRMSLLGLLCGLAALTRAEQLSLVVLVLVPLALVLRGQTLRHRLMLVGVGVATALVTLTPWVGFNLSRFSHTTFLSTDSGYTLATANCHLTYSGRWLAYEAAQCLTGTKFVAGDESAVDAQLRHIGLDYARAHAGQLPLVMVARAAREVGLLDPLQQLSQEQFINGRPYRAAEVGLIMFYVMALLSVFGAIVLRRRGITLVPFCGILIGVVVASMLTFGETRYRVPLDVAVVVLSAAGLDALLARLDGLMRRTGSSAVA